MDMNNSDEYIIACLLGPTKYEDRFGEDRFGRWPSHITVIPWFDVEHKDEAIAVMQRMAILQRKFTVVIGPEEEFGPRGTVPVMTVQSPALQNMHTMLVGEIENVGGDIPFPQYIIGNYRPHIAKKNDKVFRKNDQIVIDRLFLISAPRLESRLTRLKKIVSEIELQP
jgi:2'-5' RNA ligase